MAGSSAPALQRLSVAAAMPYATVERITRPLKADDRWPSRSRPELRASDLGSLLNAIMGGQSTEASVETDDAFRGLEYAGTWVPEYREDLEAALGPGTWGKVLDRIIENAPLPHREDEPALVLSNVAELPHLILACINPLGLEVIWLDQDGLRNRVDYYSPTFEGRIKQRKPYGEASMLIRKSFVDISMIMLAGEILRDVSPARETSSPSRTTAIPGGNSEAAGEEDVERIPALSTAPSDQLTARKTHANRRVSQGATTPEATLDVRVCPTVPSAGPPNAGHVPRRSKDGHHSRGRAA